MKTIFICLHCIAFACSFLTAFAQGTEGVINYELIVNLHRTLPPERADMKNMIPEFRRSKHQLFFNAQESLYKAVIEDEDPTEAASGNVRIRMQQPHIETYFDAASQHRIVQQEFMGKEYLIEDSVIQIPWKLTGDTKKIIDYDCQSATYHDEGRKQTITVWYTNKLRPFLGPESTNSLPGTILMMDINDGERVIIAKSVVLRTLKKSEMRVPAKGIRITQAEFVRLRDEQLQRMRANGANVIIRN